MMIDFGPRRGLPFVICAPSGTGKTTLVSRLTAEFPLEFSISCTTRAPRGTERDGVDYIFLDRETFVERRKQGYFAEWARVHSNYYGTPLAPVRDMLDSGRDMKRPVEILSSKKFRMLVEKLKQEFDIVIFDTPPVGVLSIVGSPSMLTNTPRSSIAFTSSTPVTFAEKRKPVPTETVSSSSG